jgi:citrate lyase gamma subunit
MATRMQQRRGTAAQWTAANPVLAAGEIGFETDTNKFKMGNGSSAWTALQYFANAAELAAIIDGAPDLLNTLNELAAAIGDDPAFFTNISESISDNIDLHNVTTNVHGIANTSLLATTANVATAKTEAIADAATAAGQALTSHNNLTTGVHGIDNTANLATTSSVSTAISNHNDETENVHGITNTEDLATKTYADTAVTDHNSETTDVHGIANTALLATTANITTHNEATENVHGILDTADLATQEYVNTAVGNATVDQSLFAGVGIDWNTETDQFDIDSTVATKTYADGAVSSAVTALTKSSVGLANVDNTSDANKPVSTATQTALDLKAPLADPTFTGTVSGVTKTHVGLGNVDNTSDANKPVSTATQTALDLKANLANPTFTGTVTSTNNLVVDGNLTVNGTTFNASSTSITIEDNLVQLAHQNAANTVDLGLVVGYNDGAAKHSGVVRDVSADKWKIFKGVTTEPSTTVDFTQGSLDNLQVAALEATTVTASSGVVFSDGTQTKEGVPSRTPIVQKTASYALSTLTHRDSMIEVSSASATTITIPLDSTVDYPIGTTIDILQTNTGQVTIAPVSGSVTVNATPGLKLRTRWSSATLMKRAANTWVVYGDLTA